MAEVDELILLQLGGVGLELGGVKSVASFDSTLFYRAAWKCLELISPEAVEGKAETLPTGMSQRFKATSDLAAGVLAAGYGGEMTFNHFMYPNPGVMRAVLSWLCQNLPSRDRDDEAEGNDLEEGTGGTALAGAAWELLERKQTAWDRRHQDRQASAKRVWPPLRGEYPLSRRHRKCAPHTIHPFPTPSSNEEAEWCTTNLPFVCFQPPNPQNLLASLVSFNGMQVAKEKHDALEWETSGKESGLSKKEYRRRKKELMEQRLTSASASTARYQGKFKAKLAETMSEMKVEKSRFMKEKEFGTEAVRNEAGLTEQEEAALASAVSQAELKKQQKKEEESRIKKQLKEATAQMQQLAAEAEAAEEKLAAIAVAQEADAERIKEMVEDADALEDMFHVYQQALELCEDPDNSKKLQEKMDAATTAQEALENDWKAKEKKMKAKYDQGKRELEAANGKLQEMYAEIEQTKLRMKELKVLSKKKDEEKRLLEAELEKLPKNIDRELYLRRIFDIVHNITKQQDEVEKITGQSRDTIREIGEMQEGLKRAFLVAEEKCYNEVKQDAANMYGKAVYRQLIALREAFDGLIEGVEQKGDVNQSLYEYEEKIDKMKNRNEGLDTEQVHADLSSIQSENQAANAELKELRAKLKSLVK